MGKFRSKLKGQKKGKRWPKGQSSSSNPETRKHRDQAKSRVFQENIGPSALTSDALKKHDETQSLRVKCSPLKIDENSSDECANDSSTFCTFDTFASDWSECSNESFSRLMKIFRSDSALHKEMLAVLAAVTEVIKSKGGNESSTEYYAALMTTLEVSETEESLTAILSLLAMGMKSVPRSVLQVQFSTASQMFTQILTKYSNSGNNIILKSSLNCLSILLRSQEIAIWNISSTVEILDFILSFVIHSKPKVRKVAQHAICSILKGSYFMLSKEDKTDTNKDELPKSHPITGHVAIYCVKQIESVTGAAGGQTTTLHILTLLKEIIDIFQRLHLKMVCESILKIMTLNNALVSSCCLQVLHGLFSKQSATVPADLNAQLISALYDYQPAPADIQLTVAWIVVMQQSHIHLADVNLSMNMILMPRIVQTLTQLLLTERSETINAATIALEAIIRDCIGPACESIDTSRRYKSALSQCFTILEQGLGYQYHETWKHILHLLTVIFEVSGQTCRELLIKLLKSLAELRDSYKFSYNNELERAVGAAIRSMGPETVLSTIPIITSNNDINIDRSWLLPILKENIQNSTLEYFAKYILPLAIACNQKAMALKTSHDGVGSHSMELLSIQLWALFPSYCNSPTDIKKSFKSLAKTLGSIISESKDLRLSVMAALRKLIIKSIERDNKEDVAELGRFAKNYLPILFNVYTTKPSGGEEEGQRLATLDTIKVYLPITPFELRQELYNNALDRFSNSNDAFLRESLFDLVRTLAIYQDAHILNHLFIEYIIKLFESKNHKEQKKNYRLLEDICGSENEGCKVFLSENKKDIQKLLTKSLHATATSSKGARLRCLILIIKSMAHVDGKSHLVQTALAEAITSVKDINERCRIAANNLLITLGESLTTTGQSEVYISSLMTGLVGTQQMIAATVLALTSVVKHFTGTFGNNSLVLILDNICQLLICNTREIVLACIQFIKMFITTLPSPLIASTLPVIVKSITSMTEDCRGHFRLKIRNILDRLTKKFGWETISNLVPPDDIVTHHRLRNLRKLNARKKRVRENIQDDESDPEPFSIRSKPKTIEEILADSDSDDEELKIKQNVTSKKKSNAWLQEDADDIIDFTDASTVKKIRATNPLQISAPNKSEKTKERGFKMASDGRLIIVDCLDNSDNETKNKNNLFLNSDSDDEDDKSAAETALLTTRKRKHSSDTASFTSSHPAMKYKAGGSGIHRSMALEAGAEYRSSKAKGDITQKGKVDPYAYLPFVRSNLNKRKRLKNAGQFKNIIKGAKKGAEKGAKLNKRKQC